MIDRNTLKTWLDTLPAATDIAIDDGGLTLLAINANGHPTDAYLEVGGIEEPDITSPEETTFALHRR
ncbi:hypothetical protein [Nocardia carnea]|uniref:hypothetical protein n=1 Tax=Nocardia carnea TaxID=37328 RepID=UPI00031FD19E|nr:hypothetical protein [Nocardia carnea]